MDALGLVMFGGFLSLFGGIVIGLGFLSQWISEQWFHSWLGEGILLLIAFSLYQLFLEHLFKWLYRDLRLTYTNPTNSGRYRLRAVMISLMFVHFIGSLWLYSLMQSSSASAILTLLLLDLGYGYAVKNSFDQTYQISSPKRSTVKR